MRVCGVKNDSGTADVKVVSGGRWLGFVGLWLTLGAGCRNGTHLGWDAGGMSWDPAPPRNVVGPDAGLIGTGSGPSGSHSAVCAIEGQANCCYDGEKLRGIPRCGWRRVSPGDSVTITSVYQDDQKVNLPVGLQLTAEVPANFATYEDCVNGPLGFVLSGPALEERPLLGNVEHYDLKPDGTWLYAGGGGQLGLVAASNTELSSRDGSRPLPSFRLSDGLCTPLRESKAVALIQFFDQIDFTLDGVDYRANFNTHANGEGEGRVTGYFVLVEKGF